MAAKKQSPKKPKQAGFLIRLPDSARPIMAFLKEKYRRPMTTEVVIALEKHAKEEGYKG